jgi:aryl-alcohol dehydrogenase-like predicted oxidoreductase
MARLEVSRLDLMYAPHRGSFGEVLHYHYTYLRPRADLPGRRSRGGSAGTAPRLSALRSAASETGATVNQVVLAWLMAGRFR